VYGSFLVAGFTHNGIAFSIVFIIQETFRES